MSRGGERRAGGAPGAGSSVPDPAAVRRKLLRWFAKNRRNLPWRRTGDPWAILVSEFMLQQTRVEAVIPYFERFMRRFPDAGSLAAASESEVLALWSGLGYYRRARYLKQAAERIVADHDGRIPEGASRVRELPGVGEYTAAAVSSIAFCEPVAAVDGNVIRVLARLCRLPGDARSSALLRRVRAIAQEIVAGGRPGDVNQAMMELGATVCVPADPRCPRCPVRADCRARARGAVHEHPGRASRPEKTDVRLVALSMERGDDVLLVRRHSGGLMGKLFDLPSVEVERGVDPRPRLRRLAAALGCETGRVSAAGVCRHAVTRFSIRAELMRADVRSAEPARVRRVRGGRHGIGSGSGESPRFVARDQVSDLPLTSLARKLLRLA